MLSRATVADLFPGPKPVIAMAHVPALPGTPRHPRGTSMRRSSSACVTDLNTLAAGVDAVMFCNEDDRPYARVGPEIPATMAAVVAELRPRPPLRGGHPVGPDRGDRPRPSHRRHLHARGRHRRVRERHGHLGAGCRPPPLSPPDRCRARTGHGQHHPRVRVPARHPKGRRARAERDDVVADRRHAHCRSDRRRGARPDGHAGGQGGGRGAGAGLHEHRRPGRQRRALPRGGRWRHRRLGPQGGWPHLESGRPGARGRVHGRGRPGARDS